MVCNRHGSKGRGAQTLIPRCAPTQDENIKGQPEGGGREGFAARRMSGNYRGGAVNEKPRSGERRGFRKGRSRVWGIWDRPAESNGIARSAVPVHDRMVGIRNCSVPYPRLTFTVAGTARRAARNVSGGGYGSGFGSSPFGATRCLRRLRTDLSENAFPHSDPRRKRVVIGLDCVAEQRSVCCVFRRLSTL